MNTTKYYVNVDGVRNSPFVFDSYKELLIYMKDSRGTFKDPWSYKSNKPVLLKDFCKQFRHNESDGSWTKGYYTQLVRVTGVDERGRTTWEHYNGAWNPPVFTRTPMQVTDSYGRIINAKDIWKDMQDVVVPEEKRRYWYCGGWSRSKYQKGSDWHKYRGDHSGPVPEKRVNLAHNNEANEFLYDYGTTYKVRGKRLTEFDDLWDFRRYGEIERGWKQTRKKKQWM